MIAAWTNQHDKRESDVAARLWAPACRRVHLRYHWLPGRRISTARHHADHGPSYLRPFKIPGWPGAYGLLLRTSILRRCLDNDTMILSEHGLVVRDQLTNRQDKIIYLRVYSINAAVQQSLTDVPLSP